MASILIYAEWYSALMSTNYRKLLLMKLLEHGYIGGRHTAIENLAKGFPKHDRGSIAKVVKELIKDGLIVPKPTSYGLHVSLNAARMREIEENLKQ